MRRGWLKGSFVLGVGVLCGAVLLFGRSPSVILERPAAGVLGMGKTRLSQTSGGQSAPAAGNPSAGGASHEFELADELPGPPQLRATMTDGHSRPTALIEASGALTRTMEQAFRSEAEAVKAFGQLERCVRDPEQRQAVSIRAVCLVNAIRLSKKFPQSLEEQGESLLKSAPEPVKLILTAILSS